jgi:hypothetical protein
LNFSSLICKKYFLAVVRINDNTSKTFINITYLNILIAEISALSLDIIDSLKYITLPIQKMYDVFDMSFLHEKMTF